MFLGVRGLKQGTFYLEQLISTNLWESQRMGAGHQSVKLQCDMTAGQNKQNKGRPGCFKCRTGGDPYNRRITGDLAFMRECLYDGVCKGDKMSKGPGKWQRAILEAVNQKGQMYLKEVLSQSFSESEYQAAHRAAVILWRAGKIAIHNYPLGSSRIMIGPPSCFFDRAEYDRSKRRRV
jgi:hypothetical protein